MPRESLQQTSFTAGEIDPLLASREDFGDFYQAVDRARNVVAQPTGGLTRRGGTEYIDTLPTNSTYWTNNGENKYRLIRFSARDDEKYMTVLAHDGSNAVIKLYREDGTYTVTTLDGGDAAVDLPYSADEIEDVDWTQKLDLLILCHEDYQPREIRRTGTDSFEANLLTIDSIPQYDFDDGSSPTETNEVQEIDFDGMTDGDNYDISLEGEVSAEINWSSDNADNAERIQAELRRLANTSGTGISVSVKDDGNDILEVTFGGADGAFNWSNIIVSIFTGSGSASVTETTAGESGDEDAWSATRGWPKHATFYNQRLWFAGSKELPETVWGSQIGDLFNFDLGDGDDDEAIQFTINSDQVSEITWVYHGRNLIFGTEKVEYYVPEGNLTPSDIRVEASTRRGSKKNVRPVQSDGAVYYLQRGGHALRQFVFSFSEDSYTSRNISLLASHLINDPVSMSLRQSTQTDIADLIYMVNDESGTATTLSLLKSEEVIAFTEAVTEGRFRNTRSMDFDNYFITERDIPERSDLSDTWDSKTDLPSNREQMASVKRDGTIYVIGGREGSTTVRTQQLYDIEDDSWSQKADLPSARRYASASVLGDTIYVGGGKDTGGNDTSTFWASINNSNGWEERADLPLSTSEHQLVTANDELFLITGTESHRYKPLADEWEELTGMPTEQYKFSAVSYDGNIYVIGGEDSGSNVVGTVQIYDVSDDSWSTGTDMTTNRRRASAEVALQSTGDEIWVIGGDDGNGPVNTNEAYDISGDSWSSQANMTTARDSAASAIDSLKMYVIGGDDGSDTNVNERYGFLQPVYQLEKVNADHLLDSSDRQTSGLNSTTISGLDHLQGETVDVHADGFYKGTKEVNSSGEIELDEEPSEYVEVGFDLVEPEIKLLWPTIQSGQSTVTERKKRIVEIVLDLYETRGLAVNGNKIPFRKLGGDLLDEDIPMFEGNKTIDGVTGWKEKPQVTVTQPDPQPMTLRGVIQVVSF